MAVDLCPENTRAATGSWQPAGAGAGSPRVSFSRDFTENERGREHERLDGSSVPGSPATSDFDFCVAGEGGHQEPSTADELFSEGKILPIPIQSGSLSAPVSQTTKCVLLPQASPVPPMPPLAAASRKGIIACTSDDVEPEKPPPVAQKLSTSFWKFGRSKSLDCGGGGGNGGGHGQMANFIFSMTLLTRSRSTGSSNLTPNPYPRQKQQKHQLRRAASGRASSSTWKDPRTNSSSSSSSFSRSLNSSYHYGPFHGAKNGLQINPVLNVPHPRIPKGSGGGGGGIFGIGRLLCSGKKKRSGKQGSLSSPLQPS